MSVVTLRWSRVLLSAKAVLAGEVMPSYTNIKSARKKGYQPTNLAHGNCTRDEKHGYFIFMVTGEERSLFRADKVGYQATPDAISAKTLQLTRREAKPVLGCFGKSPGSCSCGAVAVSLSKLAGSRHFQVIIPKLQQGSMIHG